MSMTLCQHVLHIYSYSIVTMAQNLNSKSWIVHDLNGANYSVSLHTECAAWCSDRGPAGDITARHGAIAGRNHRAPCQSYKV